MSRGRCEPHASSVPPLALVLLLAAAACLRPGVHAEGEGHVNLTGTEARTLEGPCALAAEPAWGVGQPWVVRWIDDSTTWSLVLRSPRRLRSGDHVVGVPAEEAPDNLALLFEGSGVRGGVAGTAHVRESEEGVVVTLRGRIEHRATWDVEAVCRAVAVETPESRR